MCLRKGGLQLDFKTDPEKLSWDNFSVKWAF